MQYADEIFYENGESIKMILKITIKRILNLSSSSAVQQKVSFFFKSEWCEIDKNRRAWVPLSSVIMVTKRRAYDVTVRELRRMYDILKRTKLLHTVPFAKAFDNVLRVLEGYNKVSIV